MKNCYEEDQNTEESVRDRGVTWFSQSECMCMLYDVEVDSFVMLVFKPGKSIKLPLYRAMWNYGGSPDTLKGLVEKLRMYQSITRYLVLHA